MISVIVFSASSFLLVAFAGAQVKWLSYFGELFYFIYQFIKSLFYGFIQYLGAVSIHTRGKVGPILLFLYANFCLQKLSQQLKLNIFDYMFELIRKLYAELFIP